MDKSILVIDKPKNCEECKLSMTTFGKLYCPPKDAVVSKGERDCSCPLVAVPEKKDYSQDKELAMASYIEGWNDFLKSILK